MSEHGIGLQLGAVSNRLTCSGVTLSVHPLYCLDERSMPGSTALPWAFGTWLRCQGREALVLRRNPWEGEWALKSLRQVPPSKDTQRVMQWVFIFRPFSETDHSMLPPQLLCISCVCFLRERFKSISGLIQTNMKRLPSL